MTSGLLEARSNLGPTPEDWHCVALPRPAGGIDHTVAASIESSSPRTLLTLPVRNEAARLTETLEKVDRAFQAAGIDYCLSVAEDGSTDGTPDLLGKLSHRWPDLLVQSDPRPLGRGLALRRLWSRTPADIYCFIDTDLPTDPEALVEAVRMVWGGAPIVVGSRYAPGARTTRPPLRSAVSKAYNRMLRAGFGDRIYDHQCGLKVFSHAAIDRLLPYSKEDSWFWDTEILVLALHAGVPVVELPVTWVERRTSRTRLLRLLSDIYLHGTGIVRLRYRLRGRTGRLPELPSPVPTAVPQVVTWSSQRSFLVRSLRAAESRILPAAPVEPTRSIEEPALRL